MIALQKLLFEKQITSFDDKISEYIPSFQKEQTIGVTTFDWKDITIRNLLTHTAGFVPTPNGFTTGIPPNLLLRDKTQALNKILLLDLQAIPGTRQLYSDVDFMIVDILIKHITNL
jgi:CubicO group peptidase (beta-lactamase class C family)